jgi:hypothetical protein
MATPMKESPGKSAMTRNKFTEVFNTLKPLISSYAESMDIETDTKNIFRLDTRHMMNNGKPLFFASIVINKSYVSYHLMPVYVFPELLNGMSPALKKRMQGKSCFNFTALEETLVSELKSLTQAGFEAYRKAGFVE